MAKTLLIVGGIANVLMTLFHVLLNYQIFHIQTLSPGLHALLEMFSIGGTLLILFLAVASLACAGDMLATRLGTLTSVLAVLVYGSRAVEEVVLSPVPSKAILGVCVLIALIYIAIPLTAPRRQPAAPVTRAA